MRRKLMWVLERALQPFPRAPLPHLLMLLIMRTSCPGSEAALLYSIAAPVSPPLPPAPPTPLTLDLRKSSCSCFDTPSRVTIWYPNPGHRHTAGWTSSSPSPSNRRVVLPLPAIDTVNSRVNGSKLHSTSVPEESKQVNGHTCGNIRHEQSAHPSSKGESL